jgi:hypothetical protein
MRVLETQACERPAPSLPCARWTIRIRSPCRRHRRTPRIAANGDPIPCKLVITNKTASGAPQYTIQFSKWQAKPSVAADSFTFAPPPDGKKLELQDFASATDMDEIPPHIGAVEKPAGDGEKQ